MAAASSSSGSTSPDTEACHAGHTKAEPVASAKVSASTGAADALPVMTSMAIAHAHSAMYRLQKNRNLGRSTASAITPANNANKKIGT